VEFNGHLLEAELGPGLLGSIIDGLQNPLEKVADATGLFLSRGIYLPPLDRRPAIGTTILSLKSALFYGREMSSVTRWRADFIIRS